MIEIPLDIPENMEPFMEPHDYKIAYGGRDSAKSWSAVRILITLSLRKKLRIVGAREVKRSIKDSIYTLICDQIKLLGLSDYFSIGKQEITNVMGSTINFEGLQEHTVDSIRSYEGIDICLVDEAHKISAESANVLIPTIRKEGSEIWFIYNPDQVSDYVHNRFVMNNDPDAVVCKMSWRDNPGFNEKMNKERLKLKELNIDLYRHIWEGECRSKAGLMFKRKWFKRYDEPPTNLNIYMASDYAVTPAGDGAHNPDWTEHGVWGLDEHGDLYAVDWWSGQTSPEEWINAAISLIRERKPMLWMDENGAIRRSLDGAIVKRMAERGAWVYRKGLSSIRGKLERSFGFAARASAGSVWIPNTSWGERLINQLCAFTGEEGKTDDMVDVCSLMARGLDIMGNALPKSVIERSTEVKPFTRAWLESAPPVEVRHWL